MKMFANKSSLGARDSGAYLLLCRPRIASPKVSGTRHKRG